MLDVHSVNYAESLILIHNCFCFYVFTFQLVQTIVVSYCTPKHSEIAECRNSFI